MYKYQEWPEEVYPPYANGPGYIVSIDIAKYIVSQHENRSLRVSLRTLALLSLFVCAPPFCLMIGCFGMADIQDGGCEHGNVGRTVQQYCGDGPILSQLEILPIRMYGRLFYSTLSISKTNTLLVG